MFIFYFYFTFIYLFFFSKERPKNMFTVTNVETLWLDHISHHTPQLNVWVMFAM